MPDFPTDIIATGYNVIVIFKDNSYTDQNICFNFILLFRSPNIWMGYPVLNNDNYNIVWTRITPVS